MSGRNRNVASSNPLYAYSIKEAFENVGIELAYPKTDVRLTHRNSPTSGGLLEGEHDF